MKTSYFDLLKDPRWQKKRLEVLNRAGWECEYCGEKKDTFHVHHRYYVAHRLPWDYPDFCFQALCKACHEDLKDGGVCDIQRHFGQKYDMWETAIDTIGESALHNLLHETLIRKRQSGDITEVIA